MVKPTLPEVIQKFWSRVEKSEAGCWEWTAGKIRDGYGSFRHPIEKRSIRSHRFSYELTHGPIPQGMEIDHICHNRACVNPEHLRLTTRKQNIENHSGAMRSSKSGVRGVHWRADVNKWQGMVRNNGKLHHVGYFDDIEDAAQAVARKRNELHTHNDMDRLADTVSPS